MKIRLKPKNSESNWVKYEDVKFLIDYLTSSQEEEIQRMTLKATLIENDADKRIALYDIAKYFIKSCIRDWEIPDVKCVLKNGLVEDELFFDVIGYDIERVMALYNDFTKKLEFTDTDKKK